jgi:hypothetical protein
MQGQSSIHYFTQSFGTKLTRWQEATSRSAQSIRKRNTNFDETPKSRRPVAPTTGAQTQAHGARNCSALQARRNRVATAHSDSHGG